MSILNNKIPINDDEINSNMDSEDKQKILLNTNVLFTNRKESRTMNNKINNTNTNTNNNQKQVFKKINLKIASRLITNNLLKIKPNMKIDMNDIAIKIKRSSIKNKQETFIPNRDSNINKNRLTISEPSIPIKVNRRNKTKKNNIKKINDNPFKTITQPIDPMTLEMEKFKKMRMFEHKNSLEKKQNQKKSISSVKRISKNKTNLNFMNLIKKHIFDQQLNKTEDMKFIENNIIYQSYKENLNKRKKGLDKIRIDKINNTNSYLNSLEIKREFNNNIINEISNIINDYNSLSLRNSAPGNKKEKQNPKKTLTVKKNSHLSSSSNNCAKDKIIRIKNNEQNNIKINKYSSFTQKNQKKIDKKKIKTNIKMVETYKSIPHRKPVFKKNNNKMNHSLNNYQRNPEKNINKEKHINKTQNKINVNINPSMVKGKEKNDVIKIKNNNVERLLEILLNYNKINFKFFWDQLKKMIIIQNAQKSKESEKEEIMKMKLNKKEKDEKNKKFFDIINNIYNNKIFLIKKSLLNKLKNFITNNKKLESIKSLVAFSNKHNKLIKIKAYNKIKSFINNQKILEATKKIYNCLTKGIFYKKYISFYEFKLLFIKSKQKNCLIILHKILSRNILDIKKDIFNEMVLYYNNKKLENRKIVRDFIIKAHKKIKKKYVYCFKSIFNYKNKFKSVKNIIKIISTRILFGKKYSFNKIKKFMIEKRKIEGIDRFNNIFIEMRLNKLMINFKEFINNIIRMRTKTAYERINEIFLLKKNQIKKDVYFKLKKDYKNKINIKKLLLILESINTRLTNKNKKYIFHYIKNILKKKLLNTRKSHENIKINKTKIEDKNSLIIEKKNTRRRWENNKIDNNNMYSIQIDSRNKMLNMKKNILKEESMSFTLSKKNENYKMNVINEKEEDSESDNEIWTTTVEKWGVIYSMDDSLYQKFDED